ncbi:MAG: carboxylate--amine ligase [Phycisphaerales bacterium]|nr:carboxylate--amine ligase [Phycisphaerales bacterium]
MSTAVDHQRTAVANASQPSSAAAPRNTHQHVPFSTRLRARLARLIRSEFWPRTVFYAPLVPVLLALAARHRSFTVFTAANTHPAFPLGGFVGESKHAILKDLPPDLTAPSTLVPPGPLDHRLNAILQHIEANAWSFPVVLKPDVGERGSAVKLIRTVEHARAALIACPDALLLQRFSPGPFEAGIFFVRTPDHPQGDIFSITDKVFPILQGDGRSTLPSLIWSHPRFRMQARTFLARHERHLDTIIPAGQSFPLAFAGNHCQGTLFRSGDHLRSDALLESIRRAASALPGFNFGRFDIRYRSPEELRQGTAFEIVELNGVLSESTDIYDPRSTLLSAYRTLIRQWRTAFTIGAHNRASGAAVPTLRHLISVARAHTQRATVDQLSD